MEVLLSLFVMSWIVSASLDMYRLVNEIDLDVDFMQDINAIHQLRLILTLGENVEVYDDEIYYQYDDDVMHLCLDDYRLMIKPGTNIVMDHVDYVYFEQDVDDYIYMTYIRENKQRRVMIRR